MGLLVAEAAALDSTSLAELVIGCDFENTSISNPSEIEKCLLPMCKKSDDGAGRVSVDTVAKLLNGLN